MTFYINFPTLSSAFAHFMITAFDSAENAGNISNLLFMFCLLFCGALATPSQFPGFQIFIYRVSPFTYLVRAMLSVDISNTDVVSAPNEYLHVDPVNSTCSECIRA